MSFAPRDTHEAQVQFALERGLPAMIGVMATQRLPYPARAFDLAHCSRCLIPWQAYGKFDSKQTLSLVDLKISPLKDQPLFTFSHLHMTLFVSICDNI